MIGTLAEARGAGRSAAARAGLLVLLAALGACAPAARLAPTPLPGAEWTWIGERLYFGRGIPGGGVVSDAEWARFIEEVVAPRFPSGMTIWRAEGRWLGADGQSVREEALVLEIFHGGDAAALASIVAIADAYKRRFRQEAVMRVSIPARVEFHE